MALQAAQLTVTVSAISEVTNKQLQNEEDNATPAIVSSWKSKRLF